MKRNIELLLLKLTDGGAGALCGGDRQSQHLSQRLLVSYEIRRDQPLTGLLPVAVGSASANGWP